MREAICLALFFWLFNSPSYDENSPEIELAVCAIFQDDAKYLPEWIEFHEAQGVEQFYLYNNLSSDDFLEPLNPYIERGLVILIDWPFEQTNIKEWNGIQCMAYMDCIQRTKHYVKWCAFIDTDEFLFCTDGSKLNNYLQDFEDFAGVGANWMLYGTSGIHEI